MWYAVSDWEAQMEITIQDANQATYKNCEHWDKAVSFIWGGGVMKTILGLKKLSEVTRNLRLFQENEN